MALIEKIQSGAEQPIRYQLKSPATLELIGAYEVPDQKQIAQAVARARKALYMLRQIFDLSDYYREATDTDINDFAALPVIKVENINELIGISDSWIRRKFSLIQQSQILETVPMNDIKAVAIEFNIPLQIVIENGVELIVLPSNKSDLKTILRFLDEDYYKSPLSKTQYTTNSKRMVW